jgi:peptidoglycan/xylan/chitin deacetylase (PgdA/CDA1 family)
MAGRQIVFLMYHELELAGRKLCQSEPGYVRYILPLETFREQMRWLHKSQIRGLNVTEALQYPSGSSVCITFDDGSETDLIAAAPVLREFGFHTTFYVTAGFLGTTGYLTAEQLRALDASGFEIGCHSMTHAYLSDISGPELKREILDAKIHIEQILGHEIAHFSCPGGRYDERTLEQARQAGFKTVANSDFHANSSATNMFELGRVAMLRDLPLASFGAICRGEGLWKKRLKYQFRRGVQRILGNRTYDRLRAATLERDHGSDKN